MICRPINEALTEEQNRGYEPNLQAFDELNTSRINEWLENDTIKDTIGNPLLLELYEDDVIIGYALLAFNKTNSYLPEATRGRYGLVDWMETKNRGVHYNCAVEIYNRILNVSAVQGFGFFTTGILSHRVFALALSKSARVQMAKQSLC